MYLIVYSQIFCMQLFKIHSTLALWSLIFQIIESQNWKEKDGQRKETNSAANKGTSKTRTGYKLPGRNSEAGKSKETNRGKSSYENNDGLQQPSQNRDDGSKGRPEGRNGQRPGYSVSTRNQPKINRPRDSKLQEQVKDDTVGNRDASNPAGVRFMAPTTPATTVEPEGQWFV